LRQALVETFAASADFTRVTTAFRARLPEDQQARWDEKLLALFGGKMPSGQLLNSAKTFHGSAEKVLRTVLLYAELMGLPKPENHYLDEHDFKELLEPFSYRNDKPILASEEDLERFEPLRQALSDTFAASNDFTRVTRAFRARLPRDEQARWDEKLLALFGGKTPSKRLLNSAKTSHGSAEKVLRTVLLYAELMGFTKPESHYLDTHDFQALLAPFRK
jgi:hypothetical protein